MAGTAALRNPLPCVLVISALGVGYGDIGTSLIYTFRECLKSSGSARQEAVPGLLSLVFCALTVVVTLKYVCFVMRADNGGEGGIIALGGLAASAERDERHRRRGALRGYEPFRPEPIRLDWFCRVLPARVLNYFGQCALVCWRIPAQSRARFTGCSQAGRCTRS